MGMQWAVQLGLHEGGYKMIETAGWPANMNIQAVYWLFGKFTTVIRVNNAMDMHCSTHTVRFYRWQNWQRAR